LYDGVHATALRVGAAPSCEATAKQLEPAGLDLGLDHAIMM
jgi:hypothetical protein